MRGVVWYFKVFFYMIEVCISNAHILHCKSPNHASISSLDFRKSVLKALVEGKCFRRDTGLHQISVAIPHIRFNRDHFHHLISHDTRSTCWVHIQEVKTIYTCAVCGIRMCPEPCFQRYHTEQLLLWWQPLQWSQMTERERREAFSKGKKEIATELTCEGL